MTEPLTAAQALAIISVLVAIAFMIETIVEALFGRPMEEFPAVAKYKKYILTYIAVAAGIIGAWVYSFDLIFLMVSYLQDTIGQPLPIGSTAFGIAATGCAIGMGSTYIHEFMGRFLLKKGEPMVVKTTVVTTSPNPEVGGTING